MIIRHFLLILHKDLCCDPSSEPSQRDGSDEASQHKVSMRNKKNYDQILPLIYSSDMVQNTVYLLVRVYLLINPLIKQTTCAI